MSAGFQRSVLEINKGTVPRSMHARATSPKTNALRCAIFLLCCFQIEALPRKLLCRESPAACKQRAAMRLGANQGLLPPPAPALPGTIYSLDSLKTELAEKETEMQRLTELTSGALALRAPPGIQASLIKTQIKVASLHEQINEREGEATATAEALHPKKKRGFSLWSSKKSKSAKSSETPPPLALFPGGGGFIASGTTGLSFGAPPGESFGATPGSASLPLEFAEMTAASPPPTPPEVEVTFSDVFVLLAGAMLLVVGGRYLYQRQEEISEFISDLFRNFRNSSVNLFTKVCDSVGDGDLSARLRRMGEANKVKRQEEKKKSKSVNKDAQPDEARERLIDPSLFEEGNK
ncbi:hypothetical protein CYMTET_28741 [Cymbomonas tetramitiformis]|uniref:Uncharacterized protein n=1 Tax=Cymbomonas tetramitiformis TaxID=36881 RepID=A0AAE0FNU9_9CHLO|nr:hypothetical protein CYMTET_28741 [Cymbomonas tetramitiformis]